VRTSVRLRSFGTRTANHSNKAAGLATFVVILITSDSVMRGSQCLDSS
jgi:hypothetical protein